MFVRHYSNYLFYLEIDVDTLKVRFKIYLSRHPFSGYYFKYSGNLFVVYYKENGFHLNYNKQCYKVDTLRSEWTNELAGDPKKCKFELYHRDDLLFGATYKSFKYRFPNNLDVDFEISEQDFFFYLNDIIRNPVKENPFKMKPE